MTSAPLAAPEVRGAGGRARGVLGWSQRRGRSDSARHARVSLPLPTSAPRPDERHVGSLDRPYPIRSRRLEESDKPYLPKGWRLLDRFDRIPDDEDVFVKIRQRLAV